MDRINSGLKTRRLKFILAAKSEISPIYSCHIYALVNSQFQNTVGQITSLSFDQGVRSHPVNCSNGGEDRYSQNTGSQPKKDIFAKKPTQKKGIAAMMSKKTEPKTEPSSSNQTSERKTAAPNTLAVKKKKTQDKNVASFFNKKPKTETNKASQLTKIESKPPKVEPKSESEDEPMEIEEPSPPKAAKKSLKKSKKHKRIQLGKETKKN